jgi:hypothetical protein
MLRYDAKLQSHNIPGKQIRMHINAYTCITIRSRQQDANKLLQTVLMRETTHREIAVMKRLSESGTSEQIRSTDEQRGNSDNSAKLLGHPGVRSR